MVEPRTPWVRLRHLPFFLLVAMVRTALLRRFCDAVAGPGSRSLESRLGPACSAENSSSARLPMKRLYILRHAKAQQAEPGQDDHARALTLRGVADAEAMARYLRKSGAKIDRVLVSTSARTVQTADLVLRELETPPRADYRDALYLAEPGKILGMIQNLPVRTSALMVIGHNPGLEELATILAREAVRRKERERR